MQMYVYLLLVKTSGRIENSTLLPIYTEFTFALMLKTPAWVKLAEKSTWK